MSVRSRVFYTESRKYTYDLPEDCREVVGVVYVEREARWPLLPMPTTKSYLRIYDVEAAPESIEDVKKILRTAFGLLTYRPLWYQHGSQVLIWPPAPDDGSRLLIEYETDDD